MENNYNNWLRQNEINIGRYLPNFVADEDNIKDILSSCNIEHNNIRLALQDLFNQFFVSTATWGLDNYETILDIPKNQSDDIYQRRNKILLKLQSKNVSTVEYMTKLAQQYFADIAKVQIVEDNANYAFKIIADRLSYDIDGLIKALNIYKPAHLAYTIIHILTASGNLYVAGVVQKVSYINIYPIDNVKIVVAPLKIYAGGYIHKSRIYELKMEGVV